MKPYKLSMALMRFIQSFEWHVSKMLLKSSITALSTGFETDVVRFLKVFCVDDAPWNPVERA